jgi:hypothetical protein
MIKTVGPVSLAFGLALWLSSDRIVFAQAGSTGGTIGKTDKSVSGGEEVAPPARPGARPTERRRNQANPDVATNAQTSRCPSIAGTWSWTGGLFGRNDTEFGADGSAKHGSGIVGTWTCSDGLYVIRWKNWTTDKVKLSADKKKLNYVDADGGFFR